MRNMKTQWQIFYEKHENSETDLLWETWKLLLQISCWKHKNVRLENTGKCTKKPYYYYDTRLYTITLQTNSKLAPGCWAFHQRSVHYRLKSPTLHVCMLTITSKRQLQYKLHQHALHINMLTFTHLMNTIIMSGDTNGLSPFS